jgi:hypothetical protein
MKLLARILSHGFAIAVVLLLAVGLIYRGELFPEYNLPEIINIGKLLDHKQKSTEGQAGAGTDEPATATGESGHDQVTIAESSKKTDQPSDSAGVVAPMDAVPVPGPDETEVLLDESAGVDESRFSQGLESGAPPVIEEIETESLELEQGAAPAAAVPGEVVQQYRAELPDSSVPLMDESGQTAAQSGHISESRDSPAALPDSDAVTPQETEGEIPAAKPQERAYQLLAAAREAYWLRDYDIAESKYINLTRLEPDNPDGYGELGNMYFSQGQWDQAASAYYEAGVRLVGQGLLEQAEELVAVIRGLNGTHADDLERKIEEARNTAD